MKTVEETRAILCEAIELVLELARDSILPLRDADTPELLRERARQIEACDTLEDFAVNHLGDD